MPASVSSPGVFRWGHVFQSFDLPLFVTNPVGNPLGPYSVTYTMYYYPKNSQCPIRVGAADRRPVNVGVGEYYATGVAGRCGQPGDWCVEWKIQEVFGGPYVTEKFCFKVFDTAAYCASTASSCGCTPDPDPCSCNYSTSSVACRKFGW